MKDQELSSGASGGCFSRPCNADHAANFPPPTSVQVEGNTEKTSNVPSKQVTHSNGATAALDSDKEEPIAIIGFSLRFPQDATSPQTFWKMLMEKRNVMTDVPTDRFNVDAFYRSGKRKPGVVSGPVKAWIGLSKTSLSSVSKAVILSRKTSPRSMLHSFQ